MNSVAVRHIFKITITKLYMFCLVLVQCSGPNWWKELEDDDELDVKYPHEHHGLAGKPSNRAKTAVLSRFVQFVDANCQSNGRPSDSYSPQFYFLSRIVPPKKNDAHVEV